MKKILICDLDGTLVEYPGIRNLPWNLTPLRIIPLRAMCLGMTTWLFSSLQKRLAEPTEAYKTIQDWGLDFVVTSGRTHFLKEPYKTINALLGTNLTEKEIFLRDGSNGFFDFNRPNRFEHKKKVIEKLQKKYKVMGVIEDEPKTRHYLEKETNVLVIPPDPERIKELK